jgi:hypothetical protein
MTYNESEEADWVTFLKLVTKLKKLKEAEAKNFEGLKSGK